MSFSIQSVGQYSVAPLSATATSAISTPRVAGSNSVIAVGEVQARRDSVSIQSAGSYFFGIAEIGAALETPARISNTLATADRALSTLGSLLGNIQSTLGETNASTRGVNQVTIDSQLASVDRVVSTTSFNGKKLLDGSFSTSLNGSALSLPSFSTSTLGKSAGGASTDSIATIRSSGTNNLSSTTSSSSAIVATAIDQVSVARQQIATFQTQAVQPMIDAGQSALEHLIASPSIDSSSSASSNGILARAQGLLQPETTANSIDPNPLHVLELLR